MQFFGTQRSYEDFKRQIPASVFPLVDELSDYCMKLNQNVVQDVRMHRIVFGKSMTFRWFADIEPQDCQVMVKIQKNRKQTPKIVKLSPSQGLDSVKELISEAYKSI